jgi:Tfp pilus assembly protein PilO
MFNGGRIWVVVGAILGVGVIALGWFIGAAPLFGQADLSDAELQQVEAQNAQYEATLAEMKALDERKDELVDEFDALKESVPPTADQEGFFDWLAQAASTAAVSLRTARVANAAQYEVADGAIGKIQLDEELRSKLYVGMVTMTVEGNADQIAAFLHLLQSDGRLQVISTANIRLGANLTADIAGYIFVIDDPKFVMLSEQPAGGDDGGETDEPDPAASETPAPDDSESPSPSDTPTPPSDAETPTARG